MPGSTRRPVSLLLAIAASLATAGCQSVSGIVAGLFGPPKQAAPPAVVQPPPALPLRADRIVVLKDKRLLELTLAGNVVASFPISLGEHPRRPKRREGDGRTPEGHYTIDWRSADTRYTRALHISYPEGRDRKHAEALHVEPGGAIFIHGLPRDYGPFDPPQWYRDWTDGCIAVGNAAIQKIWNAVPDGTPVDILP